MHSLIHADLAHANAEDRRRLAGRPRVRRHRRPPPRARFRVARVVARVALRP